MVYAGGMSKRREQTRKPKSGKVYKQPRTGAVQRGPRYDRNKDK